MGGGFSYSNEILHENRFTIVFRKVWHGFETELFPQENTWQGIHECEFHRFQVLNGFFY